MTVHAKFREGVLRSSFTEWAHKVLHNKVLSYYRDTSRRTARFTGTEDIGQYRARWGNDSELVIRLRECLQKVMTVNRRYARVLVRVYHGYSTSEICKRMGLTRANLYSMLSRARSLLKRCLDAGDI
jgi:RNA polymerase sigma factor (sigma-70 family)